MTDTVTQAKRSQIMARVRSKNTGPEVKVRQALHAAGFRFRLHLKSLPGSPDIVLPKYRTAVFVNGCLWHWHGCKSSRMPSTNKLYWENKIQRNVERDRNNTISLKSCGWHIETIWGCQLELGIRDALGRLEERRSIIRNNQLEGRFKDPKCHKVLPSS